MRNVSHEKQLPRGQAQKTSVSHTAFSGRWGSGPHRVCEPVTSVGSLLPMWLIADSWVSDSSGSVDPLTTSSTPPSCDSVLKASCFLPRSDHYYSVGLCFPLSTCLIPSVSFKITFCSGDGFSLHSVSGQQVLNLHTRPVITEQGSLSTSASLAQRWHSQRAGTESLALCPRWSAQVLAGILMVTWTATETHLWAADGCLLVLQLL